MSDIRICSLYSGSSGNSTLVECGDTSILIDAGKGARALCRALCSVGSDIEKIRAIFITHEHTDHISAIEVISKKYPIPIYVTKKSATRFERGDFPHAKSHLRPFELPLNVCVGNMSVTAFPTPHDSLMSVGYRINIKDGGESRAVGVATDIGHVTCDIREALCGCEAIVLESNHDIDMLKRGAYPYELKRRILSDRGHLSNADSAMFGAYLAEHGTRSFILAHLSEENNTPELAAGEFILAIGDSRITVLTASAELPTEIILPCKEKMPYDIC